MPSDLTVAEARARVQRWQLDDEINADLDAFEAAVKREAEEGIQALRDRLNGEMELRRMAADEIEAFIAGDTTRDLHGAAMALRHISTEEPTAADLEWARRIATEHGLALGGAGEGIRP